MNQPEPLRSDSIAVNKALQEVQSKAHVAGILLQRHILALEAENIELQRKWHEEKSAHHDLKARLGEARRRKAQIAKVQNMYLKERGKL